MEGTAPLFFKNLELDPYYHQRKKQLHKIRDKINNKESELIDFADKS